MRVNSFADLLMIVDPSIANTHSRASERGRRTSDDGENLDLVSCFGPSGPSCLVGGGILVHRRLVRLS
jgi:hypothetical protein